MGDVGQKSKKTMAKPAYHLRPAWTNEYCTQQERAEKLLVIKYCSKPEFEELVSW